MTVVCSSYVYLDPCVDAGGVVGRALDDCIVLMDNVCCCFDIAQQNSGSFCYFQTKDRLVVITKDYICQTTHLAGSLVMVPLLA